MSHTLSESGVFMGEELNDSGDLVPPENMYEACRVFARYVEHKGGTEWSFDRVLSMPVDPAFERLIESYLASVLSSDCDPKGWKIPETTLVLPWIIRMFPEVRYIYWVRDPRDSLLGEHLTDDLALFGVPYDPAEDEQQKRLTSWQYQYQIMRDTPSPRHRHNARFEDFVLRQEETVGRLESFLDMPLARIEVRPDAVGRWKSAECSPPAALFPPEVLYEAL